MTRGDTDSDADLHSLIEVGQVKAVGERLRDWPTPELAELIDGLEESRAALVFRALPRERAADVFAYADRRLRDRLLEGLTETDTRHLLASLSPDDRTALLEELPAEVTRELMTLLDEPDRREARQLLGYPEESVGRLMTPDCIALRAQWTCGRALEHIRAHGHDSEVFNTLYITDDAGKLVDVLRLRRLILSPPDTVIEELLNYRFASLSASDDREVAVDKIQRYDVNALPVTDSEGVLLGIVTVDDVFDVAEAEATEDIQLGAAVSPLDTEYSAVAPFGLFRKRVGWLVILIFVNLISAGVINRYEAYLREFITLALFMPLVIASGGNSGAQSATLMVRALATGDLAAGDWWKAAGKELLVGLLLGIAMGGLSFAVGRLYGGDPAIALVVGLSMVAIVVVANGFGALLPFALRRLRIDPAVASNPLITSIMDVLGLVVYFAVAVAVLSAGP